MAVLDQFYHQITGVESGPKLVFLHGVMGYAANWRRIAKAFESDFQILTYDQRGHGRSFQPEHGYGPENYAQDLSNILSELGWKQITLVGHSMGGRVAMHFASVHPDQVSRLVIVDIGPSMHSTRESVVTRILDQVPVPFPSKRLAKDWFDHEFPRLFADVPAKKGLADYLYANLRENEAKEAVWRFSEVAIRETVEHGRTTERWNEVRALKMATLLIRGEFSEDLPRDLYERMLKENSNIVGHEIKGAGHWVHSEQPEAFIEVVSRFIGRVPRGES